MRHSIQAAALATSVLLVAACDQTTAPGGPATLESARVIALEACDPTAGGFTAGSTNPWFPLPVNQAWEYEGEEEGVAAELTITVLDQTAVVAGVTTRVVHEHELEDGEVVEEDGAEGTVRRVGTGA